MQSDRPLAAPRDGLTREQVERGVAAARAIVISHRALIHHDYIKHYHRDPIETCDQCESATQAVAAIDDLLMAANALAPAPAPPADALRGLLERALPWIEHAIPPKGHEGSCTPETMCDMDCSDNYQGNLLLGEIRAALHTSEEGGR